MYLYLPFYSCLIHYIDFFYNYKFLFVSFNFLFKNFANFSSDAIVSNDFASFYCFLLDLERFHLISWLYYICHSTSIWYPDCIISVIPLPSDILTVLYLSFHFHLISWLYYICHSTSYNTLNISDGSGMTDMIQSGYQMEVEWQI
jgi:hypothetical protein